MEMKDIGKRIPQKKDRERMVSGRTGRKGGSECVVHRHD